ncbi:MAG TPA: nitrilase-related carbon-nitrogen hydrolase [Nitrososphaerales archaeon]|nr:nitrilase-related carbon-nitrogen hydrolase [Nitrososphaerales archaeon]
MVQRYSAAAVQFDAKITSTKSEVKNNLRHVLRTIDEIMVGYEGYSHPAKFVAFPEFAVTTYFGNNIKENMAIADTVPGEVTDTIGEMAKKHRVYVTLGGVQEVDPKWKGALFNCAPLIGPSGKVLMKYRKVQPFVPAEFCCSPHDLLPEGYDEPLFPVAKTPLGNIGLLICYDGMFPEAVRQLAYNGAEIVVHPTACPDPWGSYPTNWWEITDLAHAIFNSIYMVVPTLNPTRMSPFTWSTRSSIIDYQGRYLSRTPEQGEHIAYATIDVEALRSYRNETVGNQMLAHLRTEAYDYMKKTIYPPSPKEHRDEKLDFPKQLAYTRKAVRGFYDKSSFHDDGRE